MSDELQFNVAQLLKSPVGKTRHYDVEAAVPSVAGQATLTGPAKGDVLFTRTRQGVLVQGRFQTEADLVCDRCLNAFRQPIEFEIEEEYVPTIDVNTGKWLQLEETDPALLINEHHILDLEEVMRQAIVLALPMHPVCRPDCAGLCPGCGKDLNEGTCECEPPEPDPRWEALREFKKE